MVLVPPVTKPFVVDTEATGVADFPVYDDHSDVRAVLRLLNASHTERSERCRRYAGGAKTLEVLVGQGGPERVVQKIDLDTGPGPVAKYLVQLVGHSPLVAIVELKGDGRLCAAKIGPEPRICLVAVDEELDVVSVLEPDMRHQLE